MSDTVDDELAMVLVRKIECLRNATPNAIYLGANSIKSGSEYWLCSQGAFWATLVSLVLGLSFWVLENLRVEQEIVGVGGVIEELGSLRVKLESSLEQLQGIIDLMFSLSSLPGGMRLDLEHT